MEEKVFVIIPVYNGEKYISRCLDSVFNQSYKNIDVIVVNDGSTDRTNEILKSFDNKNLYVINKNNEGVSAARNDGLDYIKNESDNSLIVFIDADDYIDEDYILSLMKMIDDNSVDIACCSFKYQTSNSSRDYKQINESTRFSCFEATNLLVEDRTIQSHSHCKMYKKYVWDKVRFPTGIGWMEDQATIFKTFYNAKNGVFVSNYAGYHYWQEGESACRSKISNKRVIDSIIGYMEPFTFNYQEFSNEEISTIKQSALNALADTYLMMISRVDKKSLTIEQKNKLKEFRKFVNKNKIIKKFKPASRKGKLKKSAYLFARPFYRILFKLFS